MQKLTEDELTKLDEIYKLITPSQNEDPASTAAEHLQNLLDEKDKSVLGTTYKEISGIIKKIKDCKYFEKTDKEEAPTEEAEQQATEAQATETAEATEAAPAEVAEENVASAEAASNIIAGEEGVRGAEVYTAVPSDHPEPGLVSIHKILVNTFDASLLLWIFPLFKKIDNAHPTDHASRIDHHELTFTLSASVILNGGIS